MNKKGFTLTELLVVIAIIGILSVIIIPSVVKINESINQREYEQRITYIQNAAEMYASDRPEIFAGKDYEYVFVWQLVNENYLNADSNDETCNYYETSDGQILDIDSAPDEIKATKLAVGCVSNPVNSTSLNSKRVKITKKTVGIVAELEKPGDDNETNADSELLVKKVCDAIKNHKVVGKYDVPTESDSKDCECIYSGADITGLKKTGGGAVNSCILTSTSDSNGNVDNWLKYGSSSANWRVVGLYNIEGEGVVAKIITSSVVD